MDDTFNSVRAQIRQLYEDKNFYFAQTIVLEQINRRLQREVDLAEIASKMNRRVRKALLSRLEFLRERLDETTQRLDAYANAAAPPDEDDQTVPPPLHCVVCYAKVAEWGVYHEKSVHLSMCHGCAAMSPEVCPTCRQPGKLVRVYHAGISPYTEHASV